jgi:phospholipase C
MRLPTALGLVSALALAVAGANAVADDDHGRDSDFHHVHTATPIKHLVVIFQENVSFDHYFGTYPNAMNLAGETPFTAKKRTPKVNNLANPLDVNNDFGPLAGLDLLNHNPNSNPNVPLPPDNAKTYRRVEPVPAVARAGADRGSGAQ